MKYRISCASDFSSLITSKRKKKPITNLFGSSNFELSFHPIMQSLCISIYPKEDSVQTAPCSKLLSVQSEILSETLKVLRVNKGPSEV